MIIDVSHTSVHQLLSDVWRCRHCRHETSILGILICVGIAEDAACPNCRQEGIAPIAAPVLKLIQGGKS